MQITVKKIALFLKSKSLLIKTNLYQQGIEKISHKVINNTQKNIEYLVTNTNISVPNQQVLNKKHSFIGYVKRMDKI